MTHHSQIQVVLSIPLLNRVCVISDQLKLCRKKGIFLVWPLGGFFLAFQIILLGFVFSLLVLHFYIVKSVFGILIQLSLTLSILEILFKNKPPNISMVSEAKKRWVQNSYVGFFTFSKWICMAWNVLGVFTMRSSVGFLLHFYHLVDIYWT